MEVPRVSDVEFRRGRRLGKRKTEVAISRRLLQAIDTHHCERPRNTVDNRPPGWHSSSVNDLDLVPTLCILGSRQKGDQLSVLGQLRHESCLDLRHRRTRGAHRPHFAAPTPQSGATERQNELGRREKRTSVLVGEELQNAFSPAAQLTIPAADQSLSGWRVVGVRRRRFGGMLGGDGDAQR